MRAGHPWLFADSVVKQNRPGHPGELAVIYGRKDQVLGLGLFDPESPIRARMLHLGKSKPLDPTWWKSHLELAVTRRKDLFDEQTTGFRWIHGENDGWPGLVLDRYHSTLVLKLYTAAWLPRLEDLIQLFVQRFNPERLVLRLSKNITEISEREYKKDDGEVLFGSAPQEAIIFSESGLRFTAQVVKGQKTGFFLDQRDNRRRVEQLARGRHVLNAFSFSGAFSVYAARGGAKSVADLDISKHALESAKHNFGLNFSQRNVRDCRHELIHADAFEWFKQKQTKQYDMIILDPPSFARRESERAGALRAYYKLAFAALKRLNPQGILVACSCSAHVPAPEFFSTIRQAVSDSSFAFAQVQTTGHPADHPATFKEAHYLKAIYFF